MTSFRDLSNTRGDILSMNIVWLRHGKTHRQCKITSIKHGKKSWVHFGHQNMIEKSRNSENNDNENIYTRYGKRYLNASYIMSVDLYVRDFPKLNFHRIF